MIRFKEFLQEWIRSSSEEVPTFKKQKLSGYTQDLETNSPRFHIKVNKKENESRFISIHDPKTNEHIGSISCDVARGNVLRTHEMTRDLTKDHPGMIPEVIRHLHDKHGYNFYSSSTMTDGGHKVWEDLAKTHQIHASNERNGGRRVEKNVKPGKKYAGKTINSNQANTEYLLYRKKM